MSIELYKLIDKIHLPTTPWLNYLPASQQTVQNLVQEIVQKIVQKIVQSSKGPMVQSIYLPYVHLVLVIVTNDQ